MKKTRINNIVRLLKPLVPGYEKRKIQLLINTIEKSNIFVNTSETQVINDSLALIEFIIFEINQTIDMINASSCSPLYHMMDACNDFKNTISTNQFSKLDLLLQSVIVQNEQQDLKDRLVRYMNSLSLFHSVTVKCAFKPEHHKNSKIAMSSGIFPMQ